MTNAKISKVRSFEESDLSEREKMALRYTDFLKLDPRGVSDGFLEALQRHFSDAEICEIGYVVLAYGGAHNFFSSIKERVLDEEGNDLEGRGGFPLVFYTHAGVTTYQAPEHTGVDAPLPGSR